MTEQWTIYEADPSGNAADVFCTASPREALERLERYRREAQVNGRHNRTYGVYDKEEPERGDAEMLLEEMTTTEQRARWAALAVALEREKAARPGRTGRPYDLEED